ncbi:hypothetical protein PR048_015624 [Dryococelus australis]|uniref:DDE-1 domain-containing protein n=1 Tax=Dryococelus australis TaxID=614101 RepID=A0ABQ9HHG3_9NEOP|nr:hypothetical protein PR048_015624 [Dryococelus australis]
MQTGVTSYLLMGKSAKTSTFKHVSIRSLSVLYRNQKSSWMDTNIFKDSPPQVESFLKEKNLLQKALLVMDNCTSHLDTEEMVSGEIKTMFLRPNITALLQPMDQGMLANLKRNYKLQALENSHL